jgi:hypothetical protein
MQISDFDIICHWVYQVQQKSDLCSIEYGVKAWYKYYQEQNIIFVKAQKIGESSQKFSFEYNDLNNASQIVLLAYDNEKYYAIEFKRSEFECAEGDRYFKCNIINNNQVKVEKNKNPQEIKNVDLRIIDYKISEEKDRFYYAFARKRYMNIRERSWKQLCTLNLFNCFNSNNEKLTKNECMFTFKNLESVNEKVLNNFSSLWDDSDEAKDRKKKFKEFKTDCKCEKCEKERKIYFKEFEKNLSFGKFLEHFKEKHDRKCSYCGIHEKDILTINPVTKRLTTRGKTLEIDKLNAFGDYIKDNIILACYWCNNAKTDEFSCTEFTQHIAPGIRNIWNSRLGKTGIIPDAANEKCSKAE